MPSQQSNRKSKPKPAAPATSTGQTAPSSFPWPPLLYIGAIALAVMLSWQIPSPWFGRPLSDILFALGWLMIVAVAALYVGSFRALQRAGTTIRPDRAASHLVTNGPFAISRHPIYLANTMLMFALCFVSGNPWYIVTGLVAAFLTTKLAIEPEERHLEVQFGKAYRDYKKRVRRWI
ncbi:isoprenylcysteine carboxylmethyltransferase family protein [Chelativorans composti]|jgi:Putative protein-S-isoprenylcysteine methyltransferase|uniref:Methyltransferase family protein n=1 Tax=Chelativorans composti TaxID=768533 RepID=A0ABW5DJT2_9HYPH